MQDEDYVVVGASVEQMLTDGYKPVGRDFPVFLHPKTKAEYALARSERKVAPGYQGFVFHADPTITLEQDLIRRDLTINAMALDDNGNVIDPFGGQADLQKKILRHVSNAFVEDPVRILRIARFAARFTDFVVADETLQLMQNMVAAKEVDALVPERVWRELSRGLMEKKPSRMFEVLRKCGALAKILPELDRLWGIPQPEKYHPEIDTGLHIMLVIDHAAAKEFSLPIRFAALMHDLGKGVTPKEAWPRHHRHEMLGVPLVKAVCQRLRVPADCRDLAILTTREHGVIGRVSELRASTIVEVLTRCDAFRRPHRFADMLDAIACDHHGRYTFENIPFVEKDAWLSILNKLQEMDLPAIVASVGDTSQIAQKIHQARCECVSSLLFQQ